MVLIIQPDGVIPPSGTLDPRRNTRSNIWRPLPWILSVRCKSQNAFL